MISAVAVRPAIQPWVLTTGLILAAALWLHLIIDEARLAALFSIGLALGLALYHAAYGFSSAYRKAVVEGDLSAVTSHLVMLAVAIVLFAPLLSAGSVFGRPVSGAVAPVGVASAFGAMLFGIGMQLGGGCASGTLYTAGGGSMRMIVVLIFFCLGGFWATLDATWWGGLPAFASLSLGETIGWGPAVAVQLAALAFVYRGLRWAGAANRQPLWRLGSLSVETLVRGPWPLLFSAVLLAVLNALTLVVAGHPWVITWAFALWTAKVAVLFGWDPATSPFWSEGFPLAALQGSILADTVSVMNIGILFGAWIAAALAGRFAPTLRIAPASLMAAVIGGLLMGYGARLAYGCNIGAFFSGIASSSLHGWMWILCALVGTLIGIRLRPLFQL